ncbi:hypothetical protein [Dactylosporangium matsuzakiense]|uniref:Uncharacterized protein n=1 Tax=Dactylosporangium matsuzakiense TaxID=53360 RepID=A0A9W6KZE4_9ACTN|nr:hypothetical protein [Dactylosporangium matsuzakiense]UWZ46715.1 hypothetical protein Dmats_09975 [Dactylosporangium matsuzakiense]GLL08259.1 hypothetical protein GCM10017581_100200 [Dactylosporangium matsuzakiense]
MRHKRGLTLCTNVQYAQTHSGPVGGAAAVPDAGAASAATGLAASSKQSVAA